MTRQLKLCPFCGGEAELHEFQDVKTNLPSWEVICKGCGASSSMDVMSFEKAVSLWNRRSVRCPEAGKYCKWMWEDK